MASYSDTAGTTLPRNGNHSNAHGPVPMLLPCYDIIGKHSDLPHQQMASAAEGEDISNSSNFLMW